MIIKSKYSSILYNANVYITICTTSNRTFLYSIIRPLGIVNFLQIKIDCCLELSADAITVSIIFYVICLILIVRPMSNQNSDRVIQTTHPTGNILTT